MNKLFLSLTFALLLAAFVFFGPETPADSPAQEEAAEQAAEELPAPASLDDDALETFVPSEQLTADSAISFPVDI